MKKLEFGTLEVTAVVFQSPHNKNHFYVCHKEHKDFMEFMRQYNQGQQEYKQATPLEFDDSIYTKFFMVWVADCFDPPIAIVRAANEQEAEEIFVEKLPWAHITEPDLQDYNEETVGYGPNGEVYDSESVQVIEVKPVRIEV